MTEGTVDSPAGRRSARRRRIALALGLVLLAALLGLWLARKPIARDVVDRSLAERHVPARYRIADLGLGRQRLVDVVIGDPRAPDLVADWIELSTRISVDGARVTGVRAGRARLRGRVVDGKFSLGSLDRLLPASTGGGPFRLPAINLDVADGRARIETAAGLLGVKLRGSGRLDGGFRGSVAVVSPAMRASGCEATAVRLVGALSVAAARPRVVGPVRATRLACAGGSVAAPAVRADVTLGAALDSWNGAARWSTGAVTAANARAGGSTGTVTFSGKRLSTAGTVAAQGSDVVAARIGRTAMLRGAGKFVVGQRNSFDGQVALVGAAADPTSLAPVAQARGAAAGTPVGPLLAAAATAVARAGSAFDGIAAVRVTQAAGETSVSLTTASLRAASGARLQLGGDGATWSSRAGWSGQTTTLAIDGGGLPTGRATLRRAGSGWQGTLALQPYRAGPSLLALTPVAISADPAGTRLVTRATLSGPLGDGRVEQLTLPLDLRLTAGGQFALNPGCAPLGFQALAVSSLRLRAATLPLCPLDGALVRGGRGALTGGARLGATRLSGTLGRSPLTLSTSGGTVRLGDRGFALQHVGARIGAADKPVAISLGALDGRLADAGVAGLFAGASGQIGAVPLHLSDAGGSWRFARGKLDLAGTLRVSDTAATPRFQPLAADAVRLTLADNRIDARGTLHVPGKAATVADVAIVHRLGDGSGAAELTVPGLTFGDALQPEELTRLTFGVIADVHGTVSGTGRIRWDEQGVSSDGRFTTAGLDLAAAFGPVSGIAGTITFTDLLALQSAPGQVATIRSINPGVPVENGTIRYQTLPGSRVQVEDGWWPFAGGRLSLEPTLLDFSSTEQRRMTFRVDGVDAAKFLAQFDFKNLDASGTFDGVLPMVFDTAGGRIEGGHLAVRAGGGGIAYVGDISDKDLGFWGNVAFQALKSLRYRSLGITMNGPLSGEMVTEVRFAGISQGKGAKSNFLIRRLQRLPFVFNVRIKAPFRGLIDSAQSFYDPTRLIQRNLPALLQQQQGAAPTTPATPVQPPASEHVP